ncbi:YgaP family membrane protein [Kaarinaea lacus]
MVQLIDKSLQHKHPLQNISAIDRTARIIVGMALIGVWFVVDITSVNMWLALLPLIGIVPLLSGIIGWCPVNAMFNTKSCGTDSHNACGTFPYQLSRLFHK